MHKQAHAQQPTSCLLQVQKPRSGCCCLHQLKIWHTTGCQQSMLYNNKCFLTGSMHVSTCSTFRLHRTLTHNGVPNCSQCVVHVAMPSAICASCTTRWAACATDCQTMLDPHAPHDTTNTYPSHLPIMVQINKQGTSRHMHGSQCFLP